MVSMSRTRLKAAAQVLSQIEALETKLEKMLGNGTEKSNGGTTTFFPAASKEKTAKSTLSASQIATRHAQGLYLSAIRGLSPAKRKLVKQWREQKGVEWAIRKAKTLA